MSHNEIPAEEDVLNFLGRAPGPSSVREIATGLSLRHAGRRALSGVLSRLKRRRLVEELRGGQYRLAGTKAQPRNMTNPGAPSGAPPKAAARNYNLLSGR